MRRGSFRIPEVTPILLGFIVATSDTDYALLRNAVRPDFRNAEFSLFVLIQKEEVEALFGNGEHFLLSARGVYNMDPLFIFIQPAQCLSHVTKAENLTHILRHRPRFAVKGINLLMPIR